MFYFDDYALKTADDSSAYVYRGMLNDSRFNAKWSSVPDASLAKDSDVVFCRLDIPVHRDFLEELSKYSGKVFINDPISKIKYHTKDYLLEFLDSGILPGTVVSSDMNELLSFVYSKDASYIVKPLDMNGGRGVTKIHSLDSSLVDVLQSMTNSGTKPVILQDYITGVEQLGDKRINILFYEPVSAIMRYPKDGSFICNQSSGGSLHKTEITSSDMAIIEKVMPFLKRNGILWAGIDVIGPYLGEINVSSPGLLLDADLLNGNTYSLDFLLDKLK